MIGQVLTSAMGDNGEKEATGQKEKEMNHVRFSKRLCPVASKPLSWIHV